MTQTTTNNESAMIESVPEHAPEHALDSQPPMNLAVGEPLTMSDLQSSRSSLLMNPAVFEHVQRLAKMYAHSDMVPTQFQGSVPNCAIAIELAHRLGISVYMLMQSSYVVSGRPGLEAKLCIALCNQRGPFRGPIRHEYEHDDSGKIVACTAWAVHKNGEKVSATVTAKMVKAEGWADKRGSKWLTMPEQMYAYRSSVWLIRRVCPEVIMGMQTVDELEDIYNGTKYVGGDEASGVVVSAATSGRLAASSGGGGGGREGLVGALHGGSEPAEDERGRKEPEGKQRPGDDAKVDGGTEAPPPPPSPGRGGRSKS